MFCALNRTLHRERRRLAVLAVVLGLAGAVVVAHTAMNHDHMGAAMVMCLAVVETAVVAAGAALALVARWAPLSWPVVESSDATLAVVPPPDQARSRAGPSQLQIFRL
jgi:hypothetical protein